MDGKRLAEYVQSVMDAKNLKKADVERNSGNEITDTHVSDILKGKAKNPTVKIILGLAKGLDVHPVEVFKASAGISDYPEEVNVHHLIKLAQKFVHAKPQKREKVAKLLEIE